MKTLIIAVFLTLAFSATGLAQKCKEYSTPTGTFAFCPPAGWVMSKDAAGKGVDFNAPEQPDMFSAVISVDEDVVPVDRDMLAYQLIQGELKAKDYENPRLVSVRDVETASGVKGTELVFFLEMKAIPFVQTFYIFEGPKNLKLTFTLTGPQHDKDLPKIVTESMKTVRLKK
ncbi:MAG: hypothetical protein ABJA02_06355 [Acidobacteriota bacterium]